MTFVNPSYQSVLRLKCAGNFFEDASSSNRDVVPLLQNC